MAQLVARRLWESEVAGAGPVTPTGAQRPRRPRSDSAPALQQSFGAREAFALPPDADPYLVELLPQLAEDDCDETFEFGLDVIVRGLETRA